MSELATEGGDHCRQIRADSTILLFTAQSDQDATKLGLCGMSKLKHQTVKCPLVVNPKSTNIRITDPSL